MKLRAVALLMVAAVLAGACGAKGADEAAQNDKTTTSAADSSPPGSFCRSR